MKRFYSLLLSLDDAPANTPAADLVAKTKVEPQAAAELVELRQKLAREKEERKKDQLRMMELEDENKQLKTIPKPAPLPAKKASAFTTFFD